MEKSWKRLENVFRYLEFNIIFRETCHTLRKHTYFKKTQLTMKNFFICLLIILVSCTSSKEEKTTVTATKTDGNYIIEDILIETEKDVFISGIVAKNKEDLNPKPVILQHTIYVRNRDVNTLKHAVDKGYIGIITYTRGKYKSPNKIVPYEHEATDTYAVIDWISKQKWCNGTMCSSIRTMNGRFMLETTKC